MTPVKRQYRAPHRARQARETRDTIASAARKLFAEQGYAGTTIDAIAREGDVAVQTIYATFGSKRAIILALLDLMEQEGGVEQLQLDLQAAAGDPVALIRLWVEFTRRFFERGMDLLDMARAAAPIEPDVATYVETGEQRRRRGAEAFIRSLASVEALHPGLAEKRAIDILWALLSPEMFRLLVVHSGWAGEEYESWLITTLTGQLLAGTKQDSR